MKIYVSLRRFSGILILQGDIDKIERVKRRASRIMIEFEKLECKEGLKRFILTTLNDRRLSGSLIEMYI